MRVYVRVWRTDGVAGPVVVLMMRVVRVRVFVRHQLVFVPMFVMFAQVQPDARPHEDRGDGQYQRHGFIEDNYGDERADKRRRGEVGTRAGGTQLA